MAMTVARQQGRYIGAPEPAKRCTGLLMALARLVAGLHEQAHGPKALKGRRETSLKEWNVTILGRWLNR